MSNPIEFHDRIKFIDDDTSHFNIHTISTKNLKQWAGSSGAKNIPLGSKGDCPLVFVISDEYNIVGIAIEHGYGHGWDFDMSCIYDVSIISINGVGEDMSGYDRDKKLKEYGYKLWSKDYYIDVDKKSPIFISYDDAKACLNLIIRKKIQKLKNYIDEINKHINRIHAGRISIDIRSLEIHDGDAKLSIDCKTSMYSSYKSEFSSEFFIELQEVFSKRLITRLDDCQSKVDKLEKKLL